LQRIERPSPASVQWWSPGTPREDRHRPRRGDAPIPCRPVHPKASQPATRWKWFAAAFAREGLAPPTDPRGLPWVGIPTGACPRPPPRGCAASRTPRRCAGRGTRRPRPNWTSPSPPPCPPPSTTNYSRPEGAVRQGAVSPSQTMVDSGVIPPRVWGGGKGRDYLVPPQNTTNAGCCVVTPHGKLSTPESYQGGMRSSCGGFAQTKYLHANSPVASFSGTFFFPTEVVTLEVMRVRTVFS